MTLGVLNVPRGEGGGVTDLGLGLIFLVPFYFSNRKCTSCPEERTRKHNVLNFVPEQQVFQFVGG